MARVIVIPARYGSTRFPGKPLEPVAGRPLIQRVWEIARAVANADSVRVATDDSRIAEAVAQFGGRTVMTGACHDGTERVAAAIRDLHPAPEIVVNLQGDALLIPPRVIQALIAEMESDPAVELATPAVQLSRAQADEMAAAKAEGDAGGTCVTFDSRGDALYFSKSMIPFERDAADPPPVWRHIGLYAYRPEALARWVALPEGRFERAEKIEALRPLEAGMAMRVVPVALDGRTLWSIDSPGDVARAEAILTREGEPTEA